MTGFGTVVGTISLGQGKGGSEVSLSIEIKSLNSRFFEAVYKLPSVLSFLEVRINELLKKELIRGRVYLTVRITEESSSFETIVPNMNIISDYIFAASDIKKQFRLKGELTIAELLQLPEVFISRKKSISTKAELEILNLIKKALASLIEARKEEGKNLEQYLKKIFATCSKKMTKIKTLFNKEMKKKKDDIKKIRLVIQKEEDETARMKLDELYSTLNKIDVNEEISRIESHLKIIKALWKDKKIEKGKRLDFILQELVREINTINAKSSSFDINNLAVDVKVELEKAREQVQNIV